MLPLPFLLLCGIRHGDESDTRGVARWCRLTQPRLTPTTPTVTREEKSSIRHPSERHKSGSGAPGRRRRAWLCRDGLNTGQLSAGRHWMARAWPTTLAPWNPWPSTFGMPCRGLVQGLWKIPKRAANEIELHEWPGPGPPQAVKHDHTTTPRLLPRAFCRFVVHGHNSLDSPTLPNTLRCTFPRQKSVAKLESSAKPRKKPPRRHGNSCGTHNTRVRQAVWQP